MRQLNILAAAMIMMMTACSGLESRLTRRAAVLSAHVPDLENLESSRRYLESDFYSPANIYVLDHDKRSLKEFLDCQIELVAPEIRDRYLLSNWLKRFD